MLIIGQASKQIELIGSLHAFAVQFSKSISFFAAVKLGGDNSILYYVLSQKSRGIFSFSRFLPAALGATKSILAWTVVICNLKFFP
jgi:hypothetical protein